MVTTFTYKPSLVRIDAQLSYRGNRPTNTPTHTNKQTHRQDRLQYTVLLSLAQGVIMLKQMTTKPRWLLNIVIATADVEHQERHLTCKQFCSNTTASAGIAVEKLVKTNTVLANKTQQQHSHGLTDRQTNKQTERQTDRQICTDSRHESGQAESCLTAVEKRPRRRHFASDVNHSHESSCVTLTWWYTLECRQVSQQTNYMQSRC